jgi:hypothetical protein
MEWPTNPFYVGFSNCTTNTALDFFQDDDNDDDDDSLEKFNQQSENGVDVNAVLYSI